MTHPISIRVLTLAAMLLAATVTVAQDDPAAAEAAAETPEPWDVTMARGETREIDFTTSEGSWMSLDLAPDGSWITFDLLGHVYRMPSAGGEAESLTQDSGVAVNYHPAISPDGDRIAFVSDRGGQFNLWVMNADGSEPRAVFTDPTVRVTDPVWSPDGQYLFVQRTVVADMLGPPSAGIWMYHVDGGAGIEMIGIDQQGATWPSPSADGRYLYFHRYTGPPMTGDLRFDSLQGIHQMRRFDLLSGKIENITDGLGNQQVRSTSGSAYAGEVSPDGRWLAFARRIPDGVLVHKGHRFGPRTALWLRDLDSGSERVIMDPIDSDTVETFKTLRVLPGYAWSADSRQILISQGGKIRRLDVESGEVSTIPFTARVQRTISEQASADLTISDGPFQSKFMRWHTANPDGDTLAFVAVQRIFTQSLPEGRPRRLTPDDFEPFEFSPAWSPDGRWIAFTTWDDENQGHLWKVRAGGGNPQRLTEVQGEYINPAWSADGDRIVVARGSGATSRGRTWNYNLWYDIVEVPARGGAARFVTRTDNTANLGGFCSFGRCQIVRPVYGPQGRIFFRDAGPPPAAPGPRPIALVSVAPNGSDRTTHLTFPFADEMVPSRGGRWVAFVEGDNVYVAPMPWRKTADKPLHMIKKMGAVPIEQVSTEGGLFPRWRADGKVEFGSANTYFTYDPVSKESSRTDITLEIPRRIPEGTIAFTGGTIITLKDRQVIDGGSVVVDGARIACVGDCNVSEADRVIDASGKVLIPGFIDMHAHHYREHQGILPSRSFEQAIYLAYGVTTSLENSGWSQEIFSNAELIEAGVMVGSRTFSTGDPLYRGDGSRNNDLSSYEVAEQNILRLKSWGATALKQYLQPRRDQRQWVSDVARRENLMVTGENDDLAYSISNIMDGQMGFEHPLSYGILYSDFARFMGQAGAVYSPTFVVGGTGPWNEELFFSEKDLWKDEKLQRWTPWRQLVPHLRRRTLRPDTDYSYPMISQTLAEVIAEGGYGAIGSHGQQHGIASHWEVWMAAAGSGEMGALEIASVHGARFLGAENDLGTIEPGKLADILVLNSNPLNDIRNTEDMLYVMKAGVLHDADTLDEVWPEERPYGNYYWINEEALRADERGTDFFD